MAGWIKGALVVAGVVAGGAATVATAGNRTWKRAARRAVRRLESGVRTERGGVPVFPLQELPAPVARYLELALTPGQARVRRVRLRHRGEFRMGGPGDPWSPFRSTQHFSADPPGFVWDASIRMGPMLDVRVRDCYLRGEAAMLAKIAGVVPIVDRSGTPELAAGALTRWLAEAVWFPAALLPGPGLRWDAIDAGSARVTLEDGPVRVSAVFRFEGSGLPVRIEAERHRDVEGTGVLTPWTVDLRGYREVEGMRIPFEAEVAWLLPEGRLSYWRGRVVTAEYDFAPPRRLPRGASPPIVSTDSRS